jgi:predicted transcriptional regulator of viral defense system
MSYGLLARKVEDLGGGYVTRDELRVFCKMIGLDYLSGVKYLIRHGYLLRILRGVFYAKTIGERKTGGVGVNHFEAIRDALRIKGVINWYFGLETAIKLNNLTHEYYALVSVISDSIARPAPFEIMGHRVRFIRISPKLFGFGVLKNNSIPYSDIEKTLLDTIYLGRYNGLSESEIINMSSDLLKDSLKDKLHTYSLNYPNTVRKTLEVMV